VNASEARDDDLDTLARDALIESLRRENDELRGEVGHLRHVVAVGKRSAADSGSVLERAKRITRLAQLDGGRHALRSALADHDGAADWRHFLDGRARALEKRIAHEKEVLGQ